MPEIIFKEESYQIVGLCMEVHRQLGMGFREVIYKDALEIEFRENNLPYQREKLYKIEYKGIILPHKYKADFIVFDQIVLEVKSTSLIVDSFVAQTINYLKASGLKLGMIVNFGEKSLNFKRVVF
ncbi:MAG: GxxExxY protein [Flavisolibacter sp.]|jgi:GxxExxY protein|nr:GxxExxY protein [Flavisolibacter sp.]